MYPHWLQWFLKYRSCILYDSDSIQGQLICRCVRLQSFFKIQKTRLSLPRARFNCVLRLMGMLFRRQYCIAITAVATRLPFSTFQFLGELPRLIKASHILLNICHLRLSISFRVPTCRRHRSMSSISRPWPCETFSQDFNHSNSGTRPSTAHHKTLILVTSAWRNATRNRATQQGMWYESNFCFLCWTIYTQSELLGFRSWVAHHTLWHCMIARALNFSRSTSCPYCRTSSVDGSLGGWAFFSTSPPQKRSSSSVLHWQSGISKDLANRVTLCPYMLEFVDRQDTWVYGFVLQLVFRIPYSLALAPSACNASGLRAENISIGQICGVSGWV